MSKPPAKKAAAAFERGPEWRYFGFPEFEENDAAAAAASAANGGALTKPPKKIPRVRCMYCHERISARSNSLRRHLRECTKCTDEARQYCVKIDKMNFPVEPPPPSAPTLDDEPLKDESNTFDAPLRSTQDNPNDPHDATTVHDPQDGAEPTNKATQRRLKNRLACRANRKRKKAIRETLKMQVKQLSRSNSWLHQEINALLGYSLDSSSAPATSPPRSSPQASSRNPRPTYDPLAESTHMHDSQAPPRAADALADAAAQALVTVDASTRPSSPWKNKENAVAQQRVPHLQETAAAFFRWFVGVSDQREADSSPFYSRDDCEVVGERATFCDTFHVGPHVSLEAIWKTKAYLFDDLHAVQDVHVAAAGGDVVTVTIVEEGVLRDVWALRALFNPTFVVTLQLHFANSTPKVQLSWELVCHCDVTQPTRPVARRIEVALIKCDRL